MELETARLILRKFTEADYDDLYECIFRVMLRSHVELSKEPI